MLAQLDMPTGSLSTVAGVVAAAFTLTEVAKRYITEKTPVIGKIPVLLFPLVISGILTVLANKVFKDNSGKPFLEGSLSTLLISTLVAASSASGLFSWVKSPATTVGQAQPLGTTNNTGEDNTMKPNLLLLLPLLLATSLAGCQLFSISNPTQALSLQGETLATVLNVASDARDSGAVSQATLNKAQPYIDAYIKARAAAETQIANKADPTTINSLVAQANAAWTALAPQFTKLKSTTATTKPAL